MTTNNTKSNSEITDNVDSGAAVSGRGTGLSTCLIVRSRTRPVAKATATRPNSKPTTMQFAAFQGMYDYFNRVLFGGSLRPVILNFSRAANTLGFFAPDRWAQANADSKAHEISLNPAHLATRPAREVASTLAHEMVHCWQQECGTPSARGYHNQEWATKMEEIGLVPSATGAAGGAKVGFHMTHYIVDGGRFARAFDAMPPQHLLPWSSWEPEAPRRKRAPSPKNKVKYTCPACKANAWGKPDLHLICGDDDEQMIAE